MNQFGDIWNSKNYFLSHSVRQWKTDREGSMVCILGRIKGVDRSGPSPPHPRVFFLLPCPWERHDSIPISRSWKDCGFKTPLDARNNSWAPSVSFKFVYREFWNWKFWSIHPPVHQFLDSWPPNTLKLFFYPLLRAGLRKFVAFTSGT